MCINLRIILNGQKAKALGVKLESQVFGSGSTDPSTDHIF